MTATIVLFPDNAVERKTRPAKIRRLVHRGDVVRVDNRKNPHHGLSGTVTHVDHERAAPFQIRLGIGRIVWLDRSEIVITSERRDGGAS